MTTPDQFDFLRYCADHGIEYRTRASNLSRGWLLAMDCPFCDGGAHHHHMGIPSEGNRGYCWKCGGHSLFSLIRILTPHLHYDSLLEEYSDYVDIRKRLNVEHKKKIDFDFAPLGKAARKYLEGRNFNPFLLQEKYGFRDGGTLGGWAYRIVVPIYYNGEIVSYQGRTYVKGVKPKYKFLPDEMGVVNPKHIFYNLDNATGRSVIVTEGIYDCLRLSNGVDGVIASMGISTSEEQVQLLAKLYEKVYTLYDPEKTAQERARKLAQKLSAVGVKVEVCDTGLPYDLGDTPQEEADAIRKELLGR